MASFVGSEQTCPCPPACEEKSYDATTSSANWVAKKYKVRFHPCYLIQFKKDLFQEKAASLYNVSENNLEYDLLKVNVFYNSLMEKTVTDKKDYDLKVIGKKLTDTIRIGCILCREILH